MLLPLAISKPQTSADFTDVSYNLLLFGQKIFKINGRFYTLYYNDILLYNLFSFIFATREIFKNSTWVLIIIGKKKIHWISFYLSERKRQIIPQKQLLVRKHNLKQVLAHCNCRGGDHQINIILQSKFLQTIGISWQ